MTIHCSRKIIMHWCKSALCFFVIFLFRLVCWNGNLRIQRKKSKEEIFLRRIKISTFILDLVRTKNFKFWRKNIASLIKTEFNLSQLTLEDLLLRRLFLWNFSENWANIFCIIYKKFQLDCQNCLTHVQRKNLITGNFIGRSFFSYEALLVFHRTKSPSGRSFFNAVSETALTVSRLNFWGDPFWDDSVILEFFLKMRGTKWTFAEKFRIICQYGIRHDQRNNSKGEKIWKKNQYIKFH